MKHKNAQVRYNALDRCFRSKARDFNIEKLRQECNAALNELGYDGIQKRQVYKDINYMKSSEGWSIELEVKGWPRIYRYKDPSFSIQNATELNQDQKKIIKEALISLKTMSGVPALDLIDIQSVCAQLKIGLEDKEKREEVYLKDSNPHYNKKVGEHIEKLFGLISSRVNVKILYKKTNNEEELIVISPYFLKEYNSRWYLFGRSNKYPLTTTALDTIIEIREDSSLFLSKPKNLNKHYFNDFVGVTKEGTKKEEVVLKIKKEIWHLIKDRPFHKSYENQPFLIMPNDNKNYILIKHSLIPNRELQNKILYWGENITVLKPNSLREKIEEKAKEMLKNYKSVH